MCFSGERFNKGFQEFQEKFDRMKGKRGKTYCSDKNLNPSQEAWNIVI